MPQVAEDLAERICIINESIEELIAMHSKRERNIAK